MSIKPEQKPKGIIRLKEPGQVAVRLWFTGGAARADKLSAIAERNSGGRVPSDDAAGDRDRTGRYATGG